MASSSIVTRNSTKKTFLGPKKPDEEKKRDDHLVLPPVPMKPGHRDREEKRKPGKGEEEEDSDEDDDDNMDESEDEDVVVPTSVYDVGKDVDYNDPCFPSNIKIGRHMRIGQTPHVSTFSAIYCQCTVDGDPNHIAKVYNLSKLPAKPTDEQKESSYLWNLRMYSFLGESGIGLPVVTAFKCNSKIFYDMTSRETVTNISKGMPCFFVVMKGFSISLHDFYEGFIERDLIDTFKTTFYPQIATLLAKKVDWMHSLKFIHTEIHRKDVLLHFDSKETQVLDLHFIGFEDSYYRGMDRFGEEEDEEGLEEMSENNFVFTEDEDDQDEKDIWILTTHHKSDEENQGRTQDEEEYDPASEYHDPAGDHEYYYRRYYYNYDKERNNNNNNNNNNNSRVSATLLLSQKYTEVANHAISNLVKYMVDHRVNGIKVNEINFMYRDLMEVHNRINANGMSELAYPTTKTKKIFDTDKLMKMSSTDRSNVAQSISILSMMRNSQQQQQQKGNNNTSSTNYTRHSVVSKGREGKVKMRTGGVTTMTITTITKTATNVNSFIHVATLSKQSTVTSYSLLIVR